MEWMRSASLAEIQAIATPEWLSTPNTYGQLPLHRALLHRREEDIISYMIHAYPEAIYHADTGGSLPLHYAAQGRSDAVVECVLSACSNPELHAATCNARHLSPLLFAIHYGMDTSTRRLFELAPAVMGPDSLLGNNAHPLPSLLCSGLPCTREILERTFHQFGHEWICPRFSNYFLVDSLGNLPIFDYLISVNPEWLAPCVVHAAISKTYYTASHAFEVVHHVIEAGRRLHGPRWVHQVLACRDNGRRFRTVIMVAICDSVQMCTYVIQLIETALSDPTLDPNLRDAILENIVGVPSQNPLFSWACGELERECLEMALALVYRHGGMDAVYAALEYRDDVGTILTKCIQDMFNADDNIYVGVVPVSEGVRFLAQLGCTLDISKDVELIHDAYPEWYGAFAAICPGLDITVSWQWYPDSNEIYRWRQWMYFEGSLLCQLLVFC